MKLIDADELIEVAHRERLDSRERIERTIELAPTVDAEPVRHGRWLWLDGVRCSICNYKLQTTGLTSYCPNCGAKMDGERN